MRPRQDGKDHADFEAGCVFGGYPGERGLMGARCGEERGYTSIAMAGEGGGSPRVANSTAYGAGTMLYLNYQDVINSINSDC